MRFEICDDPADRIVRRGGDGNRLVSRVVSRFRERRHQGRVAVALDRPQVEARSTGGRYGARDDVTGRKLVDEALASVVEQRGPGAAERFGEQEAVVAVVVTQRGRVELNELEICK